MEALGEDVAAGLAEVAVRGGSHGELEVLWKAGDELESKIIGAWTVDVEKMKGSEDLKKMLEDPEMKRKAIMFLSMMQKMKYEISEDLITTKMSLMKDHMQVLKNKYEIISKKDNIIKLKVLSDKTKDSMISTISLLGKDRLRITKYRSEMPFEAIYLKK